jgi:hypothetical protein
MIIDIDSRKKISVYASLLVVIIVGFYNIIRTGLDPQITESLKTAGFILFLLNFPILLIDAILFKSKFRLLRDEYFWIVAAVLATCCLGFLNVRLGYFFIFAGTVCFLTNLLHYGKRMTFKEVISWVFILLIGGWFSITVWDGDYIHPMLIERLPFDDRIHIDTIFHVSIAQMIKTYSIPSTGLNGLPFFYYHFGSHFIFAFLSKTLNISAFTFYQLGFPAVFLPLFVKSLMGFPVVWSERVRRTKKYTFDWVFWLLFAGVLVGVFPLYKVLARAALEVSPIFASESYGLSIVFALLIFNIAVFNYRWRSDLHTYTLGFLPAMVILMMVSLLGLTKNSTLFMFDVLICYLFFRIGLYKQWMAWLYFAIIGAISLACLYLTVDPKSGDGSYALFDFFIKHVEMSIVPFIGVYFFWGLTLMAVCGAMIFLHKRAESKAPEYLYIFIEAVVLVSIVGALPGMFFNIDGGSGAFFLNYQMWLAFPFLLLVLPEAVKMLRQFIDRVQIPRWKYFLRISVVLFFSYVALIVGYNFRKSFKIFAKHHLEDKQRICGEPLTASGLSFADTFHEIVVLNGRIGDCLSENRDYLILTQLHALDTLSIEEKSTTVLSFGDIRMLSQKYPCYKYPFLFPALTGIALKDGFIFEDCHGRNYSFEYYKRDELRFNQLPAADKLKVVTVNLDSGSVALTHH